MDYEEIFDDLWEERGEYVHMDDLPELDHASDHMRAVFEVLYGDKDISELENHLEEVCAILGLELPDGNLTVTKEVKRG